MSRDCRKIFKFFLTCLSVVCAYLRLHINIFSYNECLICIIKRSLFNTFVIHNCQFNFLIKIKKKIFIHYFGFLCHEEKILAHITLYFSETTSNSKHTDGLELYLRLVLLKISYPKSHFFGPGNSSWPRF